MSFFSSFSLFQKARLKLTLWYVLIVLIISTAFSLGIYQLMTAELNRIEQMQQRKLESRMLRDPLVLQLPPEAREKIRERIMEDSIIEEAKKRIQFILILINLGILTAAAAAGYFLADKTLRPIQDMVDQQHRFITDASHELRTPLTALRSEMEVTLRDPKLSIKEAKDLIKSNLEEVISIQSLTDNLLKLTNTFHNHKIIKEVKLSEIIDLAVKKITPLAKQKNITIDVTTNSSVVRANETELTELIIIFLDNAIKYSPPKSIIKVIEKKKGSEAIIKIIDEGIGIDPKDIPHLFDRFYRADKSRSKTDSPGYGLGLSIAKRIVDSYKGKVDLKSTPQKGSTFIISLPTK